MAAERLRREQVAAQVRAGTAVAVESARHALGVDGVGQDTERWWIMDVHEVCTVSPENIERLEALVDGAPVQLGNKFLVGEWYEGWKNVPGARSSTYHKAGTRAVACSEQVLAANVSLARRYDGPQEIWQLSRAAHSELLRCTDLFSL